jgi:hypothetical protein
VPDDTRRQKHRKVHLFRDAVFEAESLTSMERLLLLAMSRHCDWDTGGECRPGLERLMRETAMSRRSIQRVRESLVEKGWLTLVAQGSTKKGPRASVYELPFDERLVGAGQDVHKRHGGASDGRQSGARPNLTSVTAPTTGATQAHDRRQIGTPSLPDHVRPRATVVADAVGSARAALNGEAS